MMQQETGLPEAGEEFDNQSNPKQVLPKIPQPPDIPGAGQ
jgi:hypothetical protein